MHACQPKNPAQVGLAKLAQCKRQRGNNETEEPRGSGVAFGRGGIRAHPSIPKSRRRIIAAVGRDASSLAGPVTSPPPSLGVTLLPDIVSRTAVAAETRAGSALGQDARFRRP